VIAERNEQKKIIGGTVKIVQKQKAKKHIGSGIFWLFLGIVITGVTSASPSPISVVMFGAIILGFIEIMYGIIKYISA